VSGRQSGRDLGPDVARRGRSTASRAARVLEPPESPPVLRKFVVRIDVEIEVDQRVLDAVLTDAWRERFYRLWTPGDVAGHLAYNLTQGAALSGLDGFADQPDDRACVLSIDVDDDVTEVDAPPPAPVSVAASASAPRKPRRR
jgi:hypothetical protein